MITYDWKKIWIYSKGDPAEILNIVRFFSRKQAPWGPKKKRWAKVNWHGLSFLINPEAVLTAKGYSKKELAEYVGLASFRNLAEYKTTGLKTLRMDECIISREIIDYNKLLTIENDIIHFKWE